LTKLVVASRADAETTLGEIAVASAQRDKLRADVEGRLASIRQNYEGEIDALAKSIEEKSGLLQQWAEANPGEFAERKSIEFLHGRIGFRTGTPKLKTLAGWTWDRVKGALTAAFIRTKSDVDKEGLLGAFARGEVSDGDLRVAGVRVVQDETFFVEPKGEEAGA
jgi:phage host-nuclease inhibitor protein Gam